MRLTIGRSKNFQGSIEMNNIKGRCNGQVRPPQWSGKASSCLFNLLESFVGLAFSAIAAV